jgi:hypothetical protein
MGADVHARDTFAERLERADSASLEVINCGAPHHGSRELLARFPGLADAYRPSVVVVVVESDVGRHHRATAQEELRRRSGPLGRLSSLAWRLRAGLAGSDAAVRDLVAAELDSLVQAIRGRGARPVLVLFRVDRDADWTSLRESVTQIAAPHGVPVVDLGPVIADARSRAELIGFGTGEHPTDLAHRLAAEALGPVLAPDSGSVP